MSDRMPEPGFATEARIIRVIDADTIDVEIKRTVRVRLAHPNDKNLDFNTPEKSTTLGKHAIDYLQMIINAYGPEVMVFFPAKTPDILLDNTSFNRIIGEVWLKNGIRITQLLLDSGHGKLSKRGKYEEDVGDIGANSNAS